MGGRKGEMTICFDDDGIEARERAFGSIDYPCSEVGVAVAPSKPTILVQCIHELCTTLKPHLSHSNVTCTLKAIRCILSLDSG